MEHKWSVNNLNRRISDGVVTDVDFMLESKVTSEQYEFSKRKVGAISITGSSSESDFIPFEDLKEADVLAWVNSDINHGEWEAELSASLALLENDYIEPISETGLPEGFSSTEE